MQLQDSLTKSISITTTATKAFHITFSVLLDDFFVTVQNLTCTVISIECAKVAQLCELKYGFDV